jgi:hypothetical protein
MINEYLFLSDDHRTAVEAYRPDGVTAEISYIEKTPLWIASYSLRGKSEDNAKKLSDVHETIIKYSPFVLSCESSEYYNRALFPLVNKLERKLRKLLYLAASISDNNEAKGNIKQLEEKTFGEIFDLLFIDQNFIRDMKKRINADPNSEFKGNSNYSKQEIRSYLESRVEHPLWDIILGEEDVPALRTQFRKVQGYRNDIMHAHNIDKESFGKARYLFNKINKELDSAIGKLIGASEESLAKQKPEVNTAISSALKTMDFLSAFKDASLFSRSLESISALTEMLRSSRTSETTTALDSLNNRQMSQLSKSARLDEQILDVLNSCKALQESLRLEVEGFLHIPNEDNEPDKANKEEPRIHNNKGNPEEDSPNE